MNQCETSLFAIEIDKNGEVGINVFIVSCVPLRDYQSYIPLLSHVYAKETLAPRNH